MALDPNLVISRRAAYLCCAAAASKKALEAAIVGDQDCYKKYMRTAAWYAWGAQVMSRTSAGETCGTYCVTDTFAMATIRKLDALDGCVKCGCGSPSDRPLTCVIEQDVTVYQALDALDETTIPNVAGRTTLIITNNTGVVNNWSTHLGDIATDDGAGNFTYATPADETVVYSSAQDAYYQTYPGGAGPYFPIIDGDQNFAILTLVSRTPQITLSMARTVIVEVSTDQVTWTVVYSGPETPLAYGYDVTVAGSPAYTRTTYFYGEESQCTAGPFEGTIPPFVFPPCGILEYAVTPESTCATDNWEIGVAFTQIDGWNIGTITPTVNGVVGTAVPITLGTLNFGPYIMGDLVTFEIVNNLDGACDITTQTYFDPRVVEQDYEVLRAADANEYAALNGDGNDYLIVSNVDGLVADWGLHVGEIWLGASSTYQNPANLETIYATNPGGALGFWQDDAGVPKQYFPQPLLTFNTVTLIADVTMPPVAPFTQAWATLFIQALWTSPIGNDTVYNGAPGAFTAGAFTPASAWANVTGIAAYSDGCAVRVPALLDEFTPTGEVAFYGGLNGIPYVLLPLAGTGGQFLAGGVFTQYDPNTVVPLDQVTTNRYARFNRDGTLDTAYNDIVNDSSFMVVAGTSPVGANGRYNEGALVNGRPSYEYSSAGVDYSISWSGTQWDIRNVTVPTLLYHSLSDVPLPSMATGWIADAGTLPVTVTTGGFNETVFGIDRQALGANAGKVIVIGRFTAFNDVSAPFIARLNVDGTLDNSFMANVGTGFNGYSAYGVEIQNDDKIIVVGQFTQYNGTTCNRIVRLTADGVVDPTFVGSAAPVSLRNVVLAPDATIMVNSSAPGGFNTYQGNGQPVTTVLNVAGGADYTLVRINTGSGVNVGLPAGSLNAIVAQGDQIEVGSNPTFNKFLILEDGSIIQIGTINSYNGSTVGLIAKLTSSGTLDPTFVPNNTGIGFGGAGTQETTGGAVLPNGMLLIGCNTETTFPDSTATPINQLSLARLNADGTLDETWDIGPTGFNGAVNSVAVDEFGSVIVGGSFTSFNGTPCLHLLKFL